MVVEVGLVAAMLDGRIPEGESEALVTAIRLLPGLRELSEGEINLMLVQAGERTQRGDAWLCEVARGLVHPALRRVAFRMAAMFCAWDGVIEDKEQAFLNWLTRTFGFSDDEAMVMFAQATDQSVPDSGRSVASDGVHSDSPS